MKHQRTTKNGNKSWMWSLMIRVHLWIGLMMNNFLVTYNTLKSLILYQKAEKNVVEKHQRGMDFNLRIWFLLL